MVLDETILTFLTVLNYNKNYLRVQRSKLPAEIHKTCQLLLVAIRKGKMKQIAFFPK